MNDNEPTMNDNELYIGKLEKVFLQPVGEGKFPKNKLFFQLEGQEPVMVDEKTPEGKAIANQLNALGWPGRNMRLDPNAPLTSSLTRFSIKNLVKRFDEAPLTSSPTRFSIKNLVKRFDKA